MFLKNKFMNKDLVSIITPSFNSSRFISDTIQSVLAQDYINWEMIIVEDCSSDTSVEIINKFIEKDSRIQLIVLDINVGAAEARNIAIKKSKGRYIAFLDSDDIWLPKKLSIQIQFMVENNYGFTFSSYNIMNENGQLIPKAIYVPMSIDYNGYLKNTIIGCLTVVIDKEKVGCFEMPIIKSSHDMALWLLIMKRGYKAYGIQENLATYRLVSTSNTAKKIEAAKDVWKVYREIENLNVFKSLYCFLCYTFFAIMKRTYLFQLFFLHRKPI